MNTHTLLDRVEALSEKFRNENEICWCDHTEDLLPKLVAELRKYQAAFEQIITTDHCQCMNNSCGYCIARAALAQGEGDAE